MLHWVSNASILLYTCIDVHIYMYVYICIFVIYCQIFSINMMEQRYFKHGVGFRNSRLADSLLRTILF